jgi:hypothetical protein
MLKIDEASSERGLASVFLRFEAGELALVSDDGSSCALPDGALEAVMMRFGGPLDPAERVATVAMLDLAHERTLRHVRHLSGYDVIARDYLIYEAPGAEPRCALATTVAAALAHLGRAARRAVGE